ncbi:MAG: DUF3291 domain-containing protein [Saprospiraceae bacterium]
MQLAHINIAKFVKPMAHSANAEFVNGIAEMNALAEQSEGFVWRLKDGSEGGLFGDSRTVSTISVWKNAEALKNYSYKSNHVDYFRKRAKWFHKLDKANYALWWIEDGQFPTALEAKQKLEYLWKNGVTEEVFDFKSLM